MQPPIARITDAFVANAPPWVVATLYVGLAVLSVWLTQVTVLVVKDSGASSSEVSFLMVAGNLLAVVFVLTPVYFAARDARRVLDGGES